MKKGRTGVFPQKSIEYVEGFNQVWADVIPQWIQLQLNSVLENMQDEYAMEKENRAVELMKTYMRLYRTCKPLKQVLEECVKTNRQRALVVFKNRAKRVVEAYVAHKSFGGYKEVCACCESRINVRSFCGGEEVKVEEVDVFQTCFFPIESLYKKTVFDLVKGHKQYTCFLGRIDSSGSDLGDPYCLDRTKKTEGFVLMCKRCVNIKLRQKTNYKVSDVLYNLASNESAIVWHGNPTEYRQCVPANYVTGKVQHADDKDMHRLYFWNFNEWSSSDYDNYDDAESSSSDSDDSGSDFF